MQTSKVTRRRRSLSKKLVELEACLEYSTARIYINAEDISSILPINDSQCLVRSDGKDYLINGKLDNILGRLQFA